MCTISGVGLARTSASARVTRKGPRSVKAVEHRTRGARGEARELAPGEGEGEGDAVEEQPMSQTKKRSPKPLPSSFGEGKVTGKKTLPFQDPFETNKSGRGAQSRRLSVRQRGRRLKPFRGCETLESPDGRHQNCVGETSQTRHGASRDCTFIHHDHLPDARNVLGRRAARGRELQR